MKLTAKLLVVAFALLALAGCTFTASVGGEIKTDSNFAKLPKAVETFNTCIAKQEPTTCQSFLAKEDQVISNMQPVIDVLPQLPQYVQQFGAFTWDAPKGQNTEVTDENLYILTGKTTMGANTIYARYDFVQQSGDLKLYGVIFNSNPIDAAFDQTTPTS